MSTEVPSSDAEDHVEGLVNVSDVEEEDEMSRLFDSEHEEEEPIEDKETTVATPLILPQTASTEASKHSFPVPGSISPTKDQSIGAKTNRYLAPPSARSLSSDRLDSRSRTTSSAPTAGGSRSRTTRSSAQSSTFSASDASPLPAQYRPPPFVEIPLLPLRRIRKYSFPKDAFTPSESSRSRLPGIGERSRSVYVVPDEDDGEYDLSGGSENSIQWVPAGPSRRSSRGATRNASTAPATKRSRHTQTTPSELSSDFGGYGAPQSEEDEAESEESEAGDTSDDPLAMRRNTRSNGKSRHAEKRVTRNHRSNHQHTSRSRSSRVSGETVSSDEDEYVSRPRQPQRKPRAMAGGKRKRAQGTDSESDFVLGDDPIDESESEENSIVLLDRPDGEALTQHRRFCERCSRRPADDLLEKLLEKKARAKPKKGRPKKKDEDELSEEEVLRKLEGWVETCVVNSHWGCLGEGQRYEIKHRLRLQDGPPRQGERLRHSLYIYESTTFTCAKCKSNPNCFVCHQDKLLEEETTTKGDSQPIANGASQADGDHAAEDPQTTGDSHPEAEMDPMSQEAAGPKAHIPNGDVPTVAPNVDASMEEMKSAEAKAIDTSPTKMSQGGLDEEDVEDDEPIDEEEGGRFLKFRCIRCKQCAHYEHLRNPHPEKAMSPAALAEYYQSRSDGKPAWLCHQCREWIWTVDMIIAWRPLPADAKEDFTESVPSYKEHLPREYLVKWANRSFRHVTWVTHPWLLANSPHRLRHFLEKGPALDLITDETLAARGDEMANPTIANVLEEDDRVQGTKGHTHHREEEEWKWGGPPPDVDAESSVPKEWSTVDRILDVRLRPPPLKPKSKPVPKGKGKKRRVNRVLSDSGSEESASASGKVAYPPLPDGLEPPNDQQVDIDDWEEQAGRSLTEADVDEVAGMVTWAYIKWDDLQHDQSAWDTPPPIISDLYPAFKIALERYLRARKVQIKVLSKADAITRDAMASKIKKPPLEQPETVKGGMLMPFQIEGFSWLVWNHFQRHSCILADDMGLGKTIQMASVLGYLVALNIVPCLVIVPNSTITNWVREFEKWVPHVRVVAYYGEAVSRKVISKYELYHKGLQGKVAGLKAHVVLTTYDMITGGEFSVFRNIPRWEVVCVDEGQRLKNDNALIFNRLRQLNSIHRILMTGTPLNNNIRELFNLLSFLEPTEFTDLAALEEKFDQDNLDEAKVKELHEIVRPFILRRVKADVLKLPPKIETIIPISLAPMQKQVYKLILEKNKEVLQSIVENRRKNLAKKPKKVELVEETPIVNGHDQLMDSVEVTEPPADTLPNGHAEADTAAVSASEAIGSGDTAGVISVDLDAVDVDAASKSLQVSSMDGVEAEATEPTIEAPKDVAMTD